MRFVTVDAEKLFNGKFIEWLGIIEYIFIVFSVMFISRWVLLNNSFILDRIL